MNKIEQEKESVPEPITQTPEAAFLVDLFKALSQSAIDYCVLRNYNGLPYDLKGSDIDILLRQEGVKTVRALIIATAKKHKGFAVWRELNDYLLGYFHCFGKCDNGIRWGVHIDLVIAIRWHGLDYYSSDQVLSRAVMRHGVRVANVHDANLIAFLNKLLHGGSDTKNYGPAAATAFAQSSSSTKKEIAATFGEQLDSFLHVFVAQEPGALKRVALKLRRGLLIERIKSSPLKVLCNEFKRVQVYCQRFQKRIGIFVAVLGLDGAGKSTLINVVRQDINRLLHIDTKLHYHRPGFIPSLARLLNRDIQQYGPNLNPHAKLPSGLSLSAARLAYYTLDYLIGYWFAVYPTLVKRGTVIFFDRYYYDYYIDPIRYRTNAPYWLVKLFEIFIPKPDLIIMLIPDPETYYERKPELPLDELRRQAKRMAELAKKLNNVSWIDTSGPIEESCDEMTQVVLNTFLEANRWH